MVYRSSTEGGYGIGVSTDHVDASHADRIDISDAELLFRGHFARSGPDLVLTGQDGHRLVVTGYFATEKHPDLVAPNGAHLTGDLVDLLAGSPTPGQYAQAKTTLPPDAIGKVEKVVGQVTLIHNGVAGPLHVGDPVYKTDVVQTGANSTCGIAFPDGTALDLVNNTRMALNEYNYEANSASNGAIFSLVEGTFAFVAGQVAHTGEGLKINTPVATMGVRGTVGLFRSEPTVISSNLGHVWSVFLHEDIDGSHHLGRIALIDQDPSSSTFGQVFYQLDSSDYIAYLEPQGGGQPPHVRLEPNTNAKAFENRHFFDDLGTILNSYNDANPQSLPGSGDNPGDLFPQQLFQEDGGKPLFNFGKLNGSSESFSPPSFSPLIPVMGGPLPDTNTLNEPMLNGPITNIFVWTGGTGPWTLGPNWTPGTSPGSPADIVEVPSGTVIYNNNFTIGTLIVGSKGTLDIVSGSLKVVNGATDNGTIIVEGDPPALTINGPVMVGDIGSFTATGSADEIQFADGTVDNHGAISAVNQGTVSFVNEGITNGGAIEAAGCHSHVEFSNGNLNNSGDITAKHDGIITLASERVANEAGAHIVADDGAISFEGGGFSNAGEVSAKDYGFIKFAGIDGNPADVTNMAGGNFEAEHYGQIEFRDCSDRGGGHVDNNGTIEAKDQGVVTFDDIPVTNEIGGTIDAKDGGMVIFKDVAGDTNGGFLNDGTVAAIGCGSTVDFYHTDINGGTLRAAGGSIFVSCDSTVNGSTEAGPVNVFISDYGIAHFANALGTNGPVNVTFGDGDCHGTGTLQLDQAPGCGLTIADFGVGDTIDLTNLRYEAGCLSYSWCQNDDSGVLTIREGNTFEHLRLDGVYCRNNFALVSDPQGNLEVTYGGADSRGSSIADVQSTAEIGGNTDSSSISALSTGDGGSLKSTVPSVTIGGAGNDTFVFHPGESTQTVNNFNPHNDSIEPHDFANIHDVQELAAAITPDVHSNAVLELGHGDSVAIPGVSATFLQQHLQSMVHLH